MHTLSRKEIEKLLEGLPEFQREVLKVVSQIPWGETRSYKWVAEKINKPGATRAVGQALKKNPYPFIIPCHRVIKSDGSLGGYSSGLQYKKFLLDLEKRLNSAIIKKRTKSREQLPILD